jgi:hypothetical protein
METQRLEGGYSILKYVFEDGREHYEAWPPKPDKKPHHMIGKSDLFHGALDKCREHSKLQSAA